jgi:3-phosphoshikimate 1-carboxyvinyltransferase
LRNKETDRIAMLETGLRLLGVPCESTADALTITGPVPLRAARLDAAGDHRFAMAWAIAGALVPAGGDATVIDGADAAAVSYPGFFSDLASLLRS